MVSGHGRSLSMPSTRSTTQPASNRENDQGGATMALVDSRRRLEGAGGRRSQEWRRGGTKDDLVVAFPRCYCRRLPVNTSPSCYRRKPLRHVAAAGHQFDVLLPPTFPTNCCRK